MNEVISPNETTVSKLMEDWTYDEWSSFLGLWVAGAVHRKFAQYVEHRPFLGKFIGYVIDKDGCYILLEGARVYMSTIHTVTMQAVNS